MIDPANDYVEDILGQKVRVGDFVAYGTGRGDLDVGKVIDVNAKMETYTDWGQIDPVTRKYLNQQDRLRWKYSIKVKNTAYWSSSRGTSTLSRLNNFVLVTGSSAEAVQKKIDESEKKRLDSSI